MLQVIWDAELYKSQLCIVHLRHPLVLSLLGLKQAVGLHY